MSLLRLAAIAEVDLDAAGLAGRRDVAALGGAERGAVAVRRRRTHVERAARVQDDVVREDVDRLRGVVDANLVRPLQVFLAHADQTDAVRRHPQRAN
jgi:hypothetical protein